MKDDKHVGFIKMPHYQNTRKDVLFDGSSLYGEAP